MRRVSPRDRVRNELNESLIDADQAGLSQEPAGYRIMYRIETKEWASLALIAVTAFGCTGEIETRGVQAGVVTSCMKCHNGSVTGSYTGPGIRDPHPFPGADKIACETCHGGNPQGGDQAGSHVPPPPEIGDREQQRVDPKAYFNRLTLTPQPTIINPIYL